MSTTLKHIANELGVSISTVSRGLNNHPRIGLQLREKIQKLASEKNYIPNTTAIKLKKQKTFTIGVVIPNINLHFFTNILSGMDTYAEKKGYQLITCHSNESILREQTIVEKLAKANVDGILIALTKESGNLKHLHLLQQKGFPIVYFSRGNDLFKGVYTDDFKGGFLATQHLIDQGAKSIAHIAGPWHLRHTHNREAGYLHALQINNMPKSKNHIQYTELDKENNLACAYNLLNSKNKPDAIFCFNDYVALDLYMAANVLGLKPGKDLLICGYANQPICQYVTPPLTSIDQKSNLIGEKSIELLINLIENPSLKSTFSNVILEPTLVIRQSS
ncbi:MAG: LacI family DNA-binding transcriptional regulator [Bacteroidota bacterium]|nr:LacI family DNA-binding transcriptional regulator [Bacteroidota bacterium]